MSFIVGAETVVRKMGVKRAVHRCLFCGVPFSVCRCSSRVVYGNDGVSSCIGRR